MFKNLLNSLKPSISPATSDASTQEALELISAGNAAEDGGRVQEAYALYARAVVLAPALPAAHLNLGIAYEALGDPEAARASYERVLTLDRDHPFGAYNLAKLDYLQGRLAPAKTWLQQALARKGDFVDAWVLLSNVLDELGQPQGAADAIERALRLKPDYAGALFNQAGLLRKLGRIDEATAAVEKAASLEPANADYLALYCLLLLHQGFAQEALESLRRAKALAPQRAELRSIELFLMCLVEGASVQEHWQLHRDFGAYVESIVPARRHAPLMQPKARLRLGFVSGDFGIHPVTQFLLPLLEGLRRERFEVFCYSSTTPKDHLTPQIEKLSDRWTEAADLSDSQLAAAIVSDGIDILVDLAGHTGNFRLLVFASRPAPVQVTWVGYLNTTGLTRMNYRLTDVRCDPPAQSQPVHTEELLFLPHSQWCYRPFAAMEPAPSSPRERNGFLTFGSFNNVAKLTPQIARRWGRILQSVSASRLLIAGVTSEDKRTSLLAAIAEAGDVAGRVEFAPRLDLGRYYELMNEVDIALDSYPYGGGTTTFDVLWMGVPVITAMGETPPSRSAASILAELELNAWIAPRIEEYEALAIARAADIGGLKELRGTLRERLRKSPMMDEPAFVAGFEAALERAWQAHCGGHRVESADVV